MWLRFILLSLWLSAFPANAKNANLIAFGDSNTAPRGAIEVYLDQLSGQLENVTPINAGIGGHNTKMALARLQRDVLSKDPHVVLIMFGINDAAVDVWKDPPATGSRVSLSDYEANLRQMVQLCRKAGAKPILMTPTPLRWSEKTRQLYGKPPYKPDEVEGFNLLLPDYVEAVKRVAEEEEVALFDAFAAFQAAEGGPEQLLLGDGMHLNDAGHKLIADNLLPLVRKALSTSNNP